MSIGKKVKEIRNQHGLTQYELARKANISRSYLGDIEGGRYNPSVETLRCIAEALSQPLSAFFDGATPQPASSRAVRVPVLGRVPAGIALEAIEDVLDWEEIPIEWTKGNRQFFALKLRGDSMMPKYLDDDVIIVERTDTAENGQDAVIIINGHDATFKRVLVNENGIILMPINTAYQPHFFSKSDVQRLPVTIMGVCREIRRKP